MDQQPKAAKIRQNNEGLDSHRSTQIHIKFAMFVGHNRAKTGQIGPMNDGVAQMDDPQKTTRIHKKIAPSTGHNRTKSDIK